MRRAGYTDMQQAGHGVYKVLSCYSWSVSPLLATHITESVTMADVTKEVPREFQLCVSYSYEQLAIYVALS